MAMKHARQFQTNVPRLPLLYLSSFGGTPSMFRLGSGADRGGGGGFDLG